MKPDVVRDEPVFGVPFLTVDHTENVRGADAFSFARNYDHRQMCLELAHARPGGGSIRAKPIVRLPLATPYRSRGPPPRAHPPIRAW